MRSPSPKQTETNIHNNHTIVRRDKKTGCFKIFITNGCTYTSIIIITATFQVCNICIMRSTQQYFHANTMTLSNFQVTGIQHLASTTTCEHRNSLYEHLLLTKTTMEYTVIYISMCIQHGNKYFIGTLSKAVQNCWIMNTDSSYAGKFNAMLVYSICKYPILQTKNFFFFNISYNSDEHSAA